MMSDELGMRNKGMISFIFIIHLSAFIIYFPKSIEIN